MSFLATQKNININGEQLLRLWLELDSLGKLSNYLFSQGILNEKVNKPYNTVTISRIIWMWILDNPDEALKITREYGKPISEEYWEQILVNKAHSIFTTFYHSRPRFYDWLKKMGWYDKYKDYRSTRARSNREKV